MIGGKPKISDLVIGARNMIEAADIRPGDSVLLLADRSSDGDSIDALVYLDAPTYPGVSSPAVRLPCCRSSRTREGRSAALELIIA